VDGLRRASFILRDAHAAEATLAAFFPTLRLGGGSSPVQLRFNAVAARRFSLAEYSFDGPGSAVAGSDDLVIPTASGTGYRLVHGRRELTPERPFLSPADGLDARWETHAVSLVTLDHAAVERIARVASGDDGFELRRTGTAAVSPEFEAHWTALTRGIRATIDSAPDAFASPMIQNATFHQLATAFLHAFPTNWLEAGADRTAGSSVVRRAIDFMRAHAGDPITMTDVASATFISTRGLHAAFTRELGQTPAEYLRRLRLDGAHEELTAAGTDSTVESIARRWGFGHLPRFAEAHRRAFGENPSATLRR
jgi:AraC-like DNA-binding protein